MNTEKNQGRPHMVHELIEKVRKIFLMYNFDEVENPIFIPEEDIYKQYGKEGAVILDRVFYVGGLPRPDIGLSDKEISKIKEILGEEKFLRFDIEKLKRIFRNYREGKIEGDNMIEEMSKILKISSHDAINIIDLFSAFKNIEPLCSKITLRSHMTAGWFLTLESMIEKEELPLKLFSIGLRFRREQKIDATHLRAHYGASFIIADKIKISDKLRFLEEGMKISEKILNEIGFTNIKFIKKETTSNYYEEGFEYEIFSNNIEIADCGMYSRTSLKNYNIPDDIYVFNAGFGLERILMVKNNINDVRKVLYPQFYEDIKLSDEEIAKSLEMIYVPETEEGKDIAKKIYEVAKMHAYEKSPCKFLCFDGNLMNKNVKAFVFEDEENKNLLGPAALNKIYVYEGNIYGIPDDAEKFGDEGKRIKEKGVKANIDFLYAISNYFARTIEEKIKEGANGKFYFEVKMAKNPSDINIKIKEKARRFMNTENKRIILKGPVFTGIEVEIK